MTFRIVTDGVEFIVQRQGRFGWKAEDEDGRVLTFSTLERAREFKGKLEDYYSTEAKRHALVVVE